MEQKQAEVYKLIEDHYRKHFNSNVSKLRYATGSAHNAEDTVQEAYTRALKYWKSYNFQGVENWFISILNNCIRDTQKDTILNGMVQEDLAHVVEPTRPDITDEVLANEVKREINKQPARVAQILHLYLFEGYTSRELSEFTEYSPEAVRKAVSRFKADLFGDKKAA